MQDCETLAVVIPVYKGASSLPAVVEEIIALSATLGDRQLELTEIVLVHDGAVDESARVILELEQASALVRPVWLSRNFGQHAATFAGCASTTADWVATLSLIHI